MLDRNGYYVNNKLFLIPLDDLYLLGLLNSKLFWWILNNTTSKLRGDALAMQTPYLVSLPIAAGEVNLRSEIEKKVQSVVEKPIADTSVMEAEIDQLVYRLYGLTEKEIQLVEESLKA